MSIKTKIASTLVLILVAASWLLAGEVYAERAMWVWGMARNIVLDPAAQQEFFTFCNAPKGNTANAIKVIFLDAIPYKFDLLTYNKGNGEGTELRNFLSAAHSRGIKVEFLASDTAFATPESRKNGDGLALVDKVLAFNKNPNTAPNERFDGIQFDVEPYLLNSKEGIDLYDWRWDVGIVWSQYIYLLTECQARVNEYNAANNPDMRFGAAIPWWYDTYNPNSPANSKDIISRVDYVAVMAYRDTADGIKALAEDKIKYAASVGKKVYVAVETSHPARGELPDTTTFYEEGNTKMETALTDVDNAFSGYSSYAGLAMHYYEDIAGPKVKEISYRLLTDGPRPQHYPIVRITSPGPLFNTVWSGSQVFITWETDDLDGDAIERIDIKYSSDNGATWRTLASGLPDNGAYLITNLSNPTSFPEGDYNLIKVSATDNSASHLTGYDVSRTPIKIRRTITKTAITDLHLWNDSWNNGGTSKPCLRLKWSPPQDMPKYYSIFRQKNNGSFTHILDKALVYTYKDETADPGVGPIFNKYKYQIKAVYSDGIVTVSNDSNMLVPGSEFLLDCFEQNEGVSPAGPYGTSTLIPEYSSDCAEGTKSRKLTYAYKGSDWGAIILGRLPVKVDISPYNAIAFWAKTNGFTGTGFSIQLIEGKPGEDDANEKWTSPRIKIESSNWTQYVIDLSNFSRDSAEINSRLDRHGIGSYGILFSKTDPGTGPDIGQTADGVYYVDGMRFVNNAADIHIRNYPPEGYDFGTLKGTITDHRFRLGPISVSYGGFASPWTIRIWTNNNPAASPMEAPKYAGLKGEDNVTYVPLKVWCKNYGPRGNVPPNEEDDTYWVNNTEGWFRIPEYNAMNPANIFTWRRLAWANVSQDGTIGNPFDIYLAIDVADAAVAQKYKTDTLTVEYINE